MLRRFEGKLHAGDYAKYRPIWPSVVYEKVVVYLKDGGGKPQFVADVGCGTGISTKLLAGYFDKVIGVDVSEAMLAEAPKDMENITYQCGPGEDLFFIQDESIDVISCASSIHWFDLKKFHKEVDRVLKPGGVLASYAFTLSEFVGNEDANIRHEKVSISLLPEYVLNICYYRF